MQKTRRNVLEHVIAEVTLKGNCLQEGVVHNAIVTETKSKKEDTYLGVTENHFKTRYSLHNSSFRLPLQKIPNYPQ